MKGAILAFPPQRTDSRALLQKRGFIVGANRRVGRTAETMGRRMAESGGTIKWIETIRSPTTQEWSSGGFALLERVDAIGMFDGHVRESRESAAVSGIGYRENESL